VLFLPGDVFASRRPDPVLQQLEAFGDPTLSVNDCFLEDAIRPWILLFIMPLFALMNAGFTFTSDMQWLSSVSLGVSAGLVLGKPLGVIGACWLLLRLGPGRLPEAISWRSLIGVGLLAGVGFTMSLFIGQLAFGGSELLAQAKIGILSASLIAACAGLLWLRFNLSGNSTDKTPKQ
jgi:NhaA family Na+:H+ antiporter